MELSSVCDITDVTEIATMSHNLKVARHNPVAHITTHELLAMMLTSVITHFTLIPLPLSTQFSN